MQSYSWPGNVRELKNIIERFSILNLYNKVTAEDVAAELKIKYPAVQENKGNVITEQENVIVNQSCRGYSSGENILRREDSNDIESIMSADLFQQAKENFEKAYLIRKLKENGNNVTKTAQIIGMSRRNLQKKISVLKIIF